MLRKPAILLMGVVLAVGLRAQNVFISRFIPGNYLANNLHRVDIFNPSASSRDISGYLLVTRNYSVRIPPRSVILPRAVFSVGRFSTGAVPLDLELGRTPDFLIRFPDPAISGNYVMLFDRRGEPVDGMYFCPGIRVDFLPDRDFMITLRGDSIPFSVPDERERFWKERRLSVADDPAVAFIQMDGNWIPTGIRTNLIPATAFGPPEATWLEGVAKIRFRTRFEENCYYHWIERSTDNRNFQAVGKVESAGKTIRGREYEWYDPTAEKNRKYYYRLRNRDIYGNDVLSRVVELNTQTTPEAFTIEVLSAADDKSGEITVRFWSRTDQVITIRLMGENFREEGLLFSGEVKGDVQNLLKIGQGLRPARYLLVAQTRERRFFRELVIGE